MFLACHITYEAQRLCNLNSWLDTKPDAVRCCEKNKGTHAVVHSSAEGVQYSENNHARKDKLSYHKSHNRGTSRLSP